MSPNRENKTVQHWSPITFQEMINCSQDRIDEFSYLKPMLRRMVSPINTGNTWLNS